MGPSRLVGGGELETLFALPAEHEPERDLVTFVRGRLDPEERLRPRFARRPPVRTAGGTAREQEAPEEAPEEKSAHASVGSGGGR
jgi:hypothetical protein